ncbi:hypothetical protein C5B42_01930 [Candidatus Cerribacteria bacterium 'Amazon FNV 2010 28 9']|uniref:DUF5667 domain-containing protein n=1 Tax=Candidatus Cerribacteria bacterium 'Amazon FNV 2010 28 9' TaxID=2081795 RepID=A0A317JS10_9BACT|nr:MAG: hypothetical protein C5B42_01930 [Candidatus Cerribacteria bacterium 'Amazon FNV 2010 28 9']
MHLWTSRGTLWVPFIMIKLQHLVIAAGMFLLALFILAVSFWKLTYVSPLPVDEANTLSHVSVQTRLQQIFTPPYLPDSPLFLSVVLSDRIRLALASPNQKVSEELRLGNDRLWAAQQLVARGRKTLALTTLSKAEKYVMLASGDNAHILNSSHEQLHTQVLNTISNHIDQMIAMKPYFNSAQASTIDALITQMKGLETTR